MVEILLLEEIANKVLENQNEGFTLFGIRKYAELWGKKHDMIFHAIKGISPKDLKQNSLLTIPVLQYKYPEQSREAKIYMQELFKEKPFLFTFSLRIEGEKIFSIEGENELLSGTFLKFFKTKQTPLGTEILETDGYARTNERKLNKYLPNWEKVNSHFNQLRLEINKEYEI